ncbi:substrate-binding domain-containing protein [Fundidesulfovibrio butyratiphilus]
MRAYRLAMALLVVVCATLAGCDKRESPASDTLTLITCNEASFLEPHLRRLARKEGFHLNLRYMAVQELVRELAKGQNAQADAVIAPCAEWLALAEVQSPGVLGKPVAVMNLPVALGVRQSQAQALGLEASGVDADRLCALAAEGKFTFLLSSPSQSGAGLAVYLGMVRALSGGTDPATLSPEAKEKLKAFFSGVSRSAGSHLWVKSLFETGAYPAMFNYVHVLEQTAQDMARDGGEPLVVTRVKGADMVCAAVFAPVRKKDAPKELCDKVADSLTSDRFRNHLVSQGREPADRDVSMPSGKVVADLLDVYQSQLRRPSLTVLAVELSSPMKGYAERELKRAVRQALDPGLLAERFLQSEPGDQLYLLVYADKVVKTWRLDTLGARQRTEALAQFESLTPKGGSNPYSALAEAGALAAKANCADCLDQVILVAYDNPTVPGKTMAQVRQQWQSLRREVPVQGVLFGNMTPARMDEIAMVTRGRIFDGRTDLSRAVLAARAYNN